MKSAAKEVITITKETSGVGDTITERSITPREVEDQIVDEEFGGPSLLFNGVLVPRLVRDKTNTYKIVSNPQSTLCFRTLDENPSHQRILIKNNGTEDLDYQWKKVERKVLLELLPQRDSPFYFFTNDGRIACGESKELYVSFQSSYEGVFSETWLFTTDPPLLPSTTPITLHLFGVAFWPDSCPNGKSGIIQRQITKEMIMEMVEDCVASIYWAKTKKPSIVDAPTEVDLCEKKNPGLEFSNEAVNALIALRSEGLVSAFGSPTWDYSLDTLRQELIDAHAEGYIKPADADTLLQQLYKIVDDLAFPPVVAATSSAEVQYRLCASLVMNYLLRAFEVCSALRLRMGMDPLARVPDLIFPWRQKMSIRENIRNSNQLAKVFWKLIRIHLKQLTSAISKERDPVPQTPVARLGERVGDGEQWRSSARIITRHLLGDLAEAIVTIVEGHMSGKN
ncbi:MYCBP-associated protein [Taenia solium]|eukprot:TsM_000651900 transcript=TsM_000651900 gene=TsM_000651900